MKKKEESDDFPLATQVSIHPARNLLRNQDQTDREGSNEMQKSWFNLDKIDQFGLNLTDMQFRLMQEILKEFSRTGYEDNTSPIEKEDTLSKSALKENDRASNSRQSVNSHRIADKRIRKIPRIRATQTQILEWAGIKETETGEKERVVAALSHLAQTLYCFYYNRLAYGPTGKPEKDSRGAWRKEEVMAIDTLFTIKEVRDDLSKKLQYYEMELSTVFLDQCENFYLLIPYDWREEVQKIWGKKRVSSYMLRFLIFLRYQYDMNRRSGYTSRSHQLKGGPDEVATVLKMPEKSVRRNEKWIFKALEESYAIAKTLGYL